MKPIIIFSLLSILSLTSIAQTPIDGLQKQNLSYLESQEADGYEFRSQIITEFDLANASQNVNIQLSEGFNYIITALGDSNISSVKLDIRPSKSAEIKPLTLNESLVGQSFMLEPSKSGKFRISIAASGLSASRKGFISFMVLRK